MKKVLFICTLKFCCIFLYTIAKGEEKTDEEDDNFENDIFSAYDFSQIDEVMNGDTESIYSFSYIFEEMVYGEGDLLSNIKDAVKNKVTYEISQNKRNIIKIIVLAILMGLLSNVTGAISSNSGEMGFYVIFMMLVATLLGSFITIEGVVYELINDILTFMTVLIPVFFTSVGITSGYDTSVIMSSLTLSGITVIQFLFLKVLLPLANVYMVISIVNLITKENYFSKFATMIEDFLKWSLKTILTVFIGLNLVEGLILPSKNTIIRKGVTKLASAVPIIGNSVNGVAELTVSSGEIIKNSIGGVALAALVIMALIPLVKILIFMGIYRITTVIVEPICDKRVSMAIGSVANGGSLLYKIAISSMLLFGASIAIICVVTK